MRQGGYGREVVKGCLCEVRQRGGVLLVQLTQLTVRQLFEPIQLGDLRGVHEVGVVDLARGTLLQTH